MSFSHIIGFISEWMGAIAIAWLLALSPRFRRPPIGFRYARRDGLVALSLFGIILVFAFIFAAVNPPVFPEPMRVAPAPAHSLTQAMLLAGISFLPFLAALIIRKQPVRSIGWHKGLFVPALQMGIAMAILTVFLRNRVMDVLNGLDTEGLYALMFAFGISLAEETIFRGYIQLRLGWWLGQWKGMILTSALFTLWHLPNWLQGLPLETTLVLVGLTLVQGLVLGWLMMKSGHVAAPALYRAISIWVSVLG